MQVNAVPDKKMPTPGKLPKLKNAPNVPKGEAGGFCVPRSLGNRTLGEVST